MTVGGWASIESVPNNREPVARHFTNVDNIGFIEFSSSDSARRPNKHVRPEQLVGPLALQRASNIHVRSPRGEGSTKIILGWKCCPILRKTVRNRRVLADRLEYVGAVAVKPSQRRHIVRVIPRAQALKMSFDPVQFDSLHHCRSRGDLRLSLVTTESPNSALRIEAAKHTDLLASPMGFEPMLSP
jgi:hypothetical protein